MKRSRHSPEQIVAKLHQAATELAGGRKMEEVCKSLAISPATYHRWQEHYGGADLNTVKELKALKEENTKLKAVGGGSVFGQGRAQGVAGGKMVGPARKREAVGHLQCELELSQRRACTVVGQPRATQRHVHKPDAQEQRLRERLNEFSAQRPRAGYRTACAQLQQEGLRVNPKRVQRLWREEGLKVPRRQCKKRRLGTSENGSQRRVATRPNEVWSYDFVSDQTSDGRRLRYLCVVDEFTRECLALEVRRSFRSKEVMGVLAELIVRRGVPTYLRSDNGPEFVALAVQAWLQAQAIGALYIAPGSPWENAYVESFNSRLRDEHLNREEFASLLEAQVLAAAWRRDYNEARPHSSLGYLAPAVFAARWRAPVGAAPLPAPASAETTKP